jgi:hypothetical protein
MGSSLIPRIPILSEVSADVCLLFQCCRLFLSDLSALLDGLRSVFGGVDQFA